MENPVVFAIVFIVAFIMAIAGMYDRGYHAGRRKMLEELLDKKVISIDLYVQFLKLLQK